MFPLVEGQTLLGDGGRYRFLSRLASGTFAVILKAIDTVSLRVVAVKCMKEPPLNAIGEREAALLQTLNDRDTVGCVAIVRLLDSFTEQSHFCLVLELLGDAVVVAHHGDPKNAAFSRGVLPWRQARPPFLLNDRTGEPQHKLLAFIYQRHAQSAAGQVDADDEEEDEEEVTQDEQADQEHAQPPLPSLACLPLDEIRQMAVHLCAALAFTHDHGLIHADLKPDNIVRIATSDTNSITTSTTRPRTQGHSIHTRGLCATVKLVDFGNCVERRQLPLYEADDAADVSGGFDIQTLAYRAPEIAMGVAIAPTMDLWSLGCVLAEWATGKPLFGGGGKDTPLTTTEELVDQIQWLLTGGVALQKAKAHVYGNARYYQFQAASSAHGQRDRRRKHRPGRRHDGEEARHHLPLRHRLDVARPGSVPRDEWHEFEDFVDRLLDVDPSTRLSARGAFLHPFLQKAFPFQFVFAPTRRPPQAAREQSHQEMDTLVPEEEESEEQEQLEDEDDYVGEEAADESRTKHDNKKRSRGSPVIEKAKQTKKPKKPLRQQSSTTSLKQALQLIPTRKIPQPQISTTTTTVGIKKERTTKKEPSWL